MQRWDDKKGFTIVELLIVIIVIAILAAITIVAYNGVQQRARNSQIIAGVEAYKKALMNYVIDNGSYPSIGSGRVCLGANYVGNQCWNGPAGTLYTSATVDASLAKYLPTKPTVSTNILQVTTGPDYRLGAILINSPDRIVYYLEGAGQTCLEGATGMTEMQGTQCAITLPTP